MGGGGIHVSQAFVVVFVLPKMQFLQMDNLSCGRSYISIYIFICDPAIETNLPKCQWSERHKIK